MGTYGLDGTYYKDSKERERADARFRQQREQNRLLEEQNRLIKQQQQKEQNRSTIQQQTQSPYIVEEISPEMQRLLDKQKMLEEKQQQLQIRMKHFSEVSETFINPLMKEAGINNPVAYQDKLYELYSEQPKEKELKLLDENNIKLLSENEIQQYPSEIQSKIKNSKYNKQSPNLLLIGFALSAVIALIGIFVESEIVLISAIFPISICGFMNSLTSNSKKAKKKLERQIKENIQPINSEIEKYNNSIKEKRKEWENKIRNFEKKRIDNFNYLLEIALDKLSVETAILFQEENKIDYRLQFNQYPSDWEEKRKEFYNNLNKEKAIKDGTEIFEDL